MLELWLSGFPIVTKFWSLSRQTTTPSSFSKTAPYITRFNLKFNFCLLPHELLIYIFILSIYTSVVFLAVSRQLYRWPCYWLTDSLTYSFQHLIDVWLTRHCNGINSNILAHCYVLSHPLGLNKVLEMLTLIKKHKILTFNLAELFCFIFYLLI